MGIMKTYTIPADVAGELTIAGVGAVQYSFKAGTVKAETDQDGVILEHLASVGLATTSVPAVEAGDTSKKTSAKSTAESTDKE